MILEDFERRHLRRKPALHLLECVQFDREGQVCNRELGRSLNVSEGGLLLETTLFLDPGERVSITLALYEQIIQFEGEVIHTRICGPESFSSGIRFAGPSTPQRKALEDYLRAWRSQDEP